MMILVATSPDPELEAPRRPSLEERTRSWVEERFRELGFNCLQAEALADVRASWHEAEDLIKKGARHETIVDLLT